jgi:phenylacetic acid degradation operon negative regulatory protein
MTAGLAVPTPPAAAERGDSGAAALVEGLVAAWAARRPMRAGSLLVTLLGDAILPRGGIAWLGDLIGLMGLFGVGERLVRTAAARLAAEGWLERRPTGRRSAYALSPAGARRFAQATRRIYGPAHAPWPQRWCVVLMPRGLGPRREALRRELAWQGFGSLGPGVLVHPCAEPDALAAALAGLGVTGAVLVVDGQGTASAAALRGLAAEGWDLAATTRGYEAIVARFAPLDRTLARGARLAGVDALRARLLLIHDYRRIVLRDPALPAELLPSPWAGDAAAALCRRLYARLRPPSERALQDRLGASPAGPAAP